MRFYKSKPKGGFWKEVLRSVAKLVFSYCFLVVLDSVVEINNDLLKVAVDLLDALS